MLKPSVQVHNQDGIMIAEFWDCWRLDPAPVQDLRARYEAHVRDKKRPEIVIDMSGVGFAGSAALGNFVALQRVTRQHGGRVIFCRVEPDVKEVFRISKLESLFQFVADRDAALRLISEGPSQAPADTNAAPDAQAEPRRPASGGLSSANRLRRRKPESDPG